MKNTLGENLRDWLRDAHALEEQAEKLFSGQAHTESRARWIDVELESVTKNFLANAV